MALTAYLHITGEHQQEIETDLDKDKREGGISVYGFEHAVRIPEQDGHANPNTHPRHGLIRIRKQVDETTPKLYRALCTRELLTDVRISWFEHVDGVEEEVYRVEMTRCVLMGIITQTESRGEKEDHLMGETVEIHYETIRWHYGEADGDQFFDFDLTTQGINAF